MSRSRIFVTRLLVAITLSPLAGGLWMLGQLWFKGIHPRDRWYSACVYEIIGLIAGAIVGLIWGIIAALDAPGRVNPPAQTPVTPPESN